MPSAPWTTKARPRSERNQGAAEQKHLAGGEHADDLGARAGGVGERAAEVKDGPEPSARRSGPRAFMAG